MKPNPNRHLRLLPLALVLAMALPAHAAGADSRDRDPEQVRAELEQARAELQAAARRVAELSRELGTRQALVSIGDTRPRLGILLGEDEEGGVRIAGVTPGSGADQAGLRAGDRLLRIGGRPIAGDSGARRVENARAALARLEAGKPVRLAFQRGGRVQEVDVMPGTASPLAFVRTLGTDGGLATVLEGRDLAALKELGELGQRIRSEVAHLTRCDEDGCEAPLVSEALRWKGLNLATLDPQLGRYFGTDRGVLVLSQGTLPGLQAGDVIQKVDGKDVASPRGALRAMSARPPGGSVRVTVLRDRAAREVQVTVPQPMRSLEFLRVPRPPAPPAPPAPAAPEPPEPPEPPPAPPAPPALALL
mgnify:CR=1 FL=1